uniref:Uncharacterized protein n=1 Tax=Cajanus cajan TaxID=3821 RepID=A0A151T4S2_CAJCA|nr:hypothetical protein KK1_016568 [Cajanus cajan]
MALPFLYLGIPIGANLRKTEMWKPVILEFSKKLAIWKSSFLSMAAQVCLINLILSSLPLYYMSFYKMPNQVVVKLKSI